MIDIANKAATHRVAIAEGSIYVGDSAFDLIAQRKLPKGDVLILAEMAGIQGAKMTPQLIPLCHPLNLDQVQISTALDQKKSIIKVYCRVSAHAKTGVEMEALAGVNAALLCIYDLTKMVEPALTIKDIRLLVKQGGKHGLWLHPNGVPDEIKHLMPVVAKNPEYNGVKVTIVKTSDRASQGQYRDTDELISGVEKKLTDLGMQVIATKILPNEPEQIQQYLTAHIEEHAPHLVFTLGGTGLSARDTTPDSIAQICDRQIPGLSELLRSEGSKYTEHAWLSRSIVGMKNNSLIITLPGKPKAAIEGITILQLVLSHAIKSIIGKAHHAEY
jgi:molybdenum cofactor biosynthesis protein MoaC